MEGLSLVLRFPVGGTPQMLLFGSHTDDSVLVIGYHILKGTERIRMERLVVYEGVDSLAREET